jgi:hypothetical protein
MKFVVIAAAAVLGLSSTLALAEAPSEQLHDGTITPTFHGGWVGQSSGEAGGGFDLSAATPLYGGGHLAATGEAGGAFDSARAVRVGVTPEPEIMVAGAADAAN